MSDRLAGKVIVVSGGTRGMGEAEVRGIVAHGGQVVFGGRDEQSGARIAAELGNQAIYVQLDVTRRADWKRIVAVALARFGKITGLINNAGYAVSAPLTEITDASWAEMIAVNQTAAFLGMQSVITAMLAAGGGSIINVASAAAIKANASLIAYSGAKAALIGMTRSAAAEFAASNIRVNTLIPGFFDTRLLEEASGGRGLQLGAELVPMKRAAHPREIVGAAVFLLSDESVYVTGTQIIVDGGYTA